VVEELLEAFRLAFSDAAALDDELTFDAEFVVAPKVWDLVKESASVEAALEVELVAVALPDELVVLPALPLLDEVAPPPEPLLVYVEVPIEEALPPVRDVAEFAE
jgi:hypothetical protein